jgi:hypothetical protein
VLVPIFHYVSCLVSVDQVLGEYARRRTTKGEQLGWFY